MHSKQGIGKKPAMCADISIQLLTAEMLSLNIEHGYRLEGIKS